MFFYSIRDALDMNALEWLTQLCWVKLILLNRDQKILVSHGLGTENRRAAPVFGYLGLSLIKEALIPETFRGSQHHFRSFSHDVHDPIEQLLLWVSVLKIIGIRAYLPVALRFLKVILFLLQGD